MTLSFLGTGFPHLENKSILTALDRLLVADSQTNMWNHKQITFAQFQSIVASNVESVNGLTGIVSLGLTDLDDIPDPTTGSTFLSWNGSAFVWAGGGVGETNLAANVGSGADIFKDKTSVTFNFRGLNGIQGISAVVNSDNIDISIDVSTLTAGQKTALVAATATEMAAAIDLTDLGDVTITTPSDGQVLTWNGSAWVNEDLPSSSGGFNINSLSLVTTANVTNDFVAIYSAALAAHKKISITNLLTLAGFTGDIYFKVSSSDTTPGYGATKLTATDGIKRTIVNPTAAESISFTLDYENLAAASTPATATSLLAIFDDDETYKKLTLDELFALDLTHLLKAGGAMTGALLEAKGADKASATTVDLSTATGNLVHITGTTTITGFGTVQAGARFTLVFDGIVTVTYNATSLILGSAAENITTAAGDVMVIVSEGGGNWRMESYAKASGLPLYVAPVAVTLPAVYDSTYFAGETGSAGQAVFIEPVTPFASATLEQYVGDVTNNTRVSFPVFGTGVSGSTIKLSIKKFVSPSVTFSVRIETDNAGSPSGTLAHANAYGTVSAGTVTTSFVDTTITLNGAFTLTAGVKYHVVVFAGTYGSETINSTNFYAIGFSTVNSTTRFGKHYNGSVWTTGAGEVISESGAFHEAGGGSETDSIGYRILANTNCYITSATISTNTTATRVRLFTDAGALLGTATVTAKVGTFSPAVPLVSGDYYRIEADNSGASYQSYFDSSPTFPTGTNITYNTGSQNQSNSIAQRNITHISTVTQTKYFFPYTSSALFQDYVLSLTDADYTYKTDYLGVLSEAMALGGNPKVVLPGGIDSNQSLSGVSNRADLYLSNTPGNISSTPGTNQKTIGVKHSDTKILVEKKLTLKTSTSGVTSGTAETDMFVNAYATSGGTNQTLIGSSNGNTMQSCSSGNTGVTTQWSICFPVKKGATWSVSGSMGSITVWTTPLS